MTTVAAVRRFGAAILFSASFALAACEAPTGTGSDGVSIPDVPIDATALMSSAAASDEGGSGLRLLNRSRDGFVVYEGGQAEYFGFRRRNNDAVETTVSRLEGNMICLEEVDSWTGVCMELWQKADGRIEVRYEFGNGHGSRYDVVDLRMPTSSAAPANS